MGCEFWASERIERIILETYLENISLSFRILYKIWISIGNNNRSKRENARLKKNERTANGERRLNMCILIATTDLNSYCNILLNLYRLILWHKLYISGRRPTTRTSAAHSIISQLSSPWSELLVPCRIRADWRGQKILRSVVFWTDVRTYIQISQAYRLSNSTFPVTNS